MVFSLCACQSQVEETTFPNIEPQFVIPEEPETVELVSRMHGERSVPGLETSLDPLGLVYSGTSYGSKVVYAQGGRVNGTFGGAFYSVSALDDGRFRTDTFLFDDQTTVGPHSRVDAPTKGNATFNGRYEMRSATNIEPGFTRAVFDSERLTGNMTLNADFQNNQVSASTNDFDLAGKFEGSGLTGTVTHNGIVGDLNGLLTKPDSGQDILLLRGAFQGSDQDRGAAFAGGLVVLTDP